ncbi:type IV pilus modification protein PilV [Neptunicella sp. SCSIO 80796]|uniref:type IV pilus modification protein PilV n=1 Tax=Neptunicella plasticusilytica TaxID=3117012 RepID=UPI003A4D5245
MSGLSVQYKHQKMQLPQVCSATRQHGVGMIEVLVTLFILAIGMLGVASLQFVGAFSNSDALNRSNAVMVAQQMAERLRANSYISSTVSGPVVDNNYFDPDLYNFESLTCASSAPPWQCFCRQIPASIPDCNANTCSTAELARFDAWQMSCAASKIDPTVKLSLSCNDNNAGDADACSVGSRHRVMLTWPVENWQNIDRQLNAVCNPDSDAEPVDCVVIDLVL